MNCHVIYSPYKGHLVVMHVAQCKQELLVVFNWVICAIKSHITADIPLLCRYIICIFYEWCLHQSYFGTFFTFVSFTGPRNQVIWQRWRYCVSRSPLTFVLVSKQAGFSSRQAVASTALPSSAALKMLHWNSQGITSHTYTDIRAAFSHIYAAIKSPCHYVHVTVNISKAIHILIVCHQPHKCYSLT